MLKKFWTSHALMAGALAALLGHAPAQAADDAANFPNRNIRMLVAFGPGSPPDVVARVVGAGLEQKLGKPVIVENISGASGLLAAKTAARSAADGHTLMVVDMSFIVARHAVAAFDIDPMKVLKPVGLAARSPFTLIVKSSLPANNIAEFIKLAKEKPDQVIIGHVGVGTTPHLGYLSFANATGINTPLVPYRNVGDAVNNMMTGDIGGFFTATSTAMSVQGSDKVKVLAITGEKRSPKLPNLPTFAESGVDMKGFEQGAWFGVVAPAGTPDDIIAKLNAALNDVSKDDNLSGRLAAAGVEMTSGTPASFGKFMGDQDAYWGKTLRDAGITPQ